MKRIIAISFLLGLIFNLFSQVPSWQQVDFENTQDVNHLHTDSLGFLWLVDQNTLYRFDGVSLTEKFTLQDEKITDLSISNDVLLVCTEYGRILEYNPYTFTHRNLIESEDYSPTTGILYQDENNYLRYSYSHGVTVVHNNFSYFFDAENGLISEEVYDVLFENGRYYLATDQGIQTINLSEESPQLNSIMLEDGLSDLIITKLIKHQSKIWYCDYDKHVGIIKDNKPGRQFSLPQSATINKLLPHNTGLYVATDVGVFRFDKEVWTKIFPLSGDAKILDIEIDEEGNLWLVNSDHALIKGNLIFQKLKVSLPSIHTAVRFNGAFYFGNEDGFFSYKNGNLYQINFENITSVLVVENYLILGTFSNGIKVYDKNLQLIDATSTWHDIKNQSVLFLAYDNGNLYASSLSGVIKFDFKKGKIAPTQSLNSVLGSEYIYSILPSGDFIYFGTDRNGLIRWNQETDEIHAFRKLENGDKIGSVYAIDKDSDGRIWFTSSNLGIAMLERKEISVLNGIRNLSDEYTSLANLPSGGILAVRSESVDLIDPNTLHIMYYDKEIGIEKEKPYLNNINSDSNSTYFVHHGYVYVYSNSASNKIHPEVIIEDVLVNLIPIENENTFAQNENNIEFTFAGSWLTDPSKLSYQYKLEGFENEWRNTKDNTIAFPKLQPGSYNFRLRASENGHFRDEPETSFQFKIRRHFYNLWWVRLIASLFIAYLVFLGIRINDTRKKEKLALDKLNIENQFINLKNQLNPHFLFNAFNTLIGLIEEDSERSVEFVEKMTSFYRNILEFGKMNLISLEKEVEMLSQYIAILEARFDKCLDIQLVFEEDTDKYAIPPMTLQLLMENAVKHNVVSSKSPLKIKFIQKGAEVLISNNKTQLLQEVKSTKMGLKNISRRFKLLGFAEPEIHDKESYFEVLLHLKPNQN